MFKRMLTAAAALCLMTGSASALDFGTGVYGSLFGGAGSGQTVEPGVSGNSDSGTMVLKGARTYGGALGFSPMPGVRAELEIAHRRAGISSYVDHSGYFEGSSSANLAGSSDSLSSLSLMMNVWRDVELSPTVGMHFGGGVGLSQLHLNLASISVLNDPFDSTKMAAAAQLGLGVDVKVGDRATLSLDYRYFVTNAATFTSAGGGTTVHQGFRDQGILIALRIPLGGP